MKRLSYYRLYAIALAVISIFPFSTHVYGETHLALDNLSWDANYQLWDLDVLENESRKISGVTVETALEDDLYDDSAGVSLAFLKTQTTYPRVLHLLSHGVTNGDIMFDVYDLDDTTQIYAAIDSLDALGMVNGIDFVATICSTGNIEHMAIFLTQWGIGAHFRNSFFDDNGLVVANVSWSLNSPGWLGGTNGEVTTMVGKHHQYSSNKQLYRLAYALGCGDDPYDTLSGRVGSSVRYSNPLLDTLGWVGDSTNSLFKGGTPKRTWSCGDPAARILNAYYDCGMVYWDVENERNTISYRLLGSKESRYGRREIVSSEVFAKGSGSSYGAPVSDQWDWVHIQEKERLFRNEFRWVDLVSIKPKAEPRGERIDFYSDRSMVLSNAGNVQSAVSKRASMNQDSVLVIAQANLWNWGIEQYAAKLRERYSSVRVEYIDFPATHDSSYVAGLISGGNEKYVLLFGRVGHENSYPSATMPIAWLNVPEYYFFLGHQLTAGSFADWANHESNGAFGKSIGYLPITSVYDVETYYWKMYDHLALAGSSGYERKLGLWGYDEDYVGPYEGTISPGKPVRMAIEALSDSIHPYWERSALLASTLDPNTAITDSSLSALLEGRAIVCMLSSVSSREDWGFIIHRDDDDYFNALRFTNTPSHFLSLSCQGSNIDFYSQVNPTLAVAEKLLLVPDGGALTSIGPSRGFAQWYYIQYAREFFEQLAAAAGPVCIGDIHNSVLQGLYEQFPNDTTELFCKTMILLGDPTMPVYGMFGNSVVSVNNEVAPPPRLVLYNAQPTPFNPNTKISFSIPSAGRVRLCVYDVRGRQVREIANARLGGGHHDFIWDGKDGKNRNSPSGIYFSRLEYSGKVLAKRMVLLR